MEIVTWSLIVANAISFMLHAVHIRARYKCGNSNSCCACDGTIEQSIQSTTSNTVISHPDVK